MKLLFPLDKKITVSLIGDVVKGIDVDCIITFLSFVDKSPFVRRVTCDVDIGAIAGQKPVTVVKAVRQSTALLRKCMEQKVPAFRLKFVSLLRKGRF